MTTQHDYVIANQSHTAIRADLNDALLAIASQNSGASAPGTTYAYQLWADTANGLWKIRDSTNSSWLTIGPIAPTQAVQRSYLGVDAPTVSCSVGSSALTIALKTAAGADASSALPLSIAFRSATLSSGAINVRTVTGALSVVISSGSTLGASNGVARTLYVYAIDNAGTVELGVSGANFGTDFIGTSVAEGGAGAADDPGVIYSTTARTSVAMKLIAILTDSQTTAGTYAAVPTAITYPGAADQHFDRPAYPMITGRYYNPTLPLFSNSATPGVTSTTIYVPYVQTETRSMAAFSVWVTTLSSGKNIRLGLYSDNAGVPGALIATIGTASTTTTGIKDVSFGKVIPAGRYWIGVQCEDTSLNYRAVSFTAGSSYAPLVGMGYDFSAGSDFAASSAYAYYTQAQGYASGLPAAASGLSGVTYSTGSMPAIYAKA